MTTLQLLDPGVEGDDQTGDFLPDAAKKLNANDRYLELMRQHSHGSAPVPIITGLGDSNIGHFHNPFLSSPWFQAAIRARGFNAYVPTEWAFSAPGVRSGPLRVTMIAALRAKIQETGIIPIIADVSSGQNDGLVQLDAAQQSYINITGLVQDALDLGIPNVLLWGMLPDPKIIGRGRPEALDWLNTALMNFAQVTPGVFFINLLELVKDRSGTAESLADPAVWWRRGTQANGQYVQTHGSQPGLGAIGSTGIDNEHPAMFFGATVAPVLERYVSRILGEMPRPDVSWADYDPAYNPNGNYLGKRGLMAGKGGLLRGVESDDVPAFWEITGDFDQLGAATITPSIYVDANGDRAIRLTGSGVPTGSGVIKMATRMAYAAPDGKWMTTGQIRRRNMRGFSGWSWSGPGGGFGTAGGLANVMPFEVSDDLYPRSMAPFSWSNTFNGQELSWSTAFVAGVELAGTIDFLRTCQSSRS